MKIVYHKKFNEVYTSDPASAPGRIESIYNELKSLYDFINAEPASDDDLKLAHTVRHIEYVRGLGKVYNIALLAVGGAVKASLLAINGEPAFALIRPPGHHAGKDSSWGFCYFNNIAIAIRKLKSLNYIKRALIVDFDLHYGDGTAEIFRECGDIIYYHVPYDIHKLENFISNIRNIDILAVSAGFDRHIDDWGGMLTYDDYKYIGDALRKWSSENCGGKRFAVLEGGYNHNVLGKAVKMFLNGFF